MSVNWTEVEHKALANQAHYFGEHVKKIEATANWLRNYGITELNWDGYDVVTYCGKDVERVERIIVELRENASVTLEKASYEACQDWEVSPNDKIDSPHWVNYTRSTYVECLGERFQIRVMWRAPYVPDENSKCRMVENTHTVKSLECSVE